MNLSWSSIGAALAALAGVVGTVLNPIVGTGISTSVGVVIQALSGLLILIGSWHVSSVAATQAKINAMQKASTLSPNVHLHL